MCWTTTRGRSPTVVEVARPLNDLNSWADARLEAMDPRDTAVEEIISGNGVELISRYQIRTEVWVRVAVGKQTSTGGHNRALYNQRGAGGDDNAFFRALEVLSEYVTVIKEDRNVCRAGLSWLGR